jgi:hypothetical protein
MVVGVVAANRLSWRPLRRHHAHNDARTAFAGALLGAIQRDYRHGYLEVAVLTTTSR